MKCVVGVSRSVVKRTAAMQAAVVAVTVCLMLQASVTLAASPTMMPGFPLRVGPNVMLMWTPIPGATEYNVYRGEAKGGPYKKIGSGPANNYMDPNVPTDKDVYYVVKGVAGGKETDPSPEVFIAGVKPVATPSITAHLVSGKDKISLRWTSVDGAMFYNLYRSDKKDGRYSLVSSVQETSFTDTVGEGKTVFYILSAVNRFNVESPKSEPYTASAVQMEQKAAGAAVSLVPRKIKTKAVFFGDPQDGLSTPTTVASDGKGGYYVLDSRGFIQQFNESGQYQQSFARIPAGQTRDSWGIASHFVPDPKTKTIYVAYSISNKVRVFDENWQLVKEFGLGKPSSEIAPNQAYVPDLRSVAPGIDGKIWVLDGAYWLLQAFDPNGKQVFTFGVGREHPDLKKDPDSGLIGPTRMAVSPKTGKIFIAEPLINQVSILDRDGKRLGKFGSRGWSPGAFGAISNLAFDGEGLLYICDSAYNRVQVFDDDGKYLFTYVKPERKDEQWRILDAVAGGIASGDTLAVSSILLNQVVLFQVLD